MTTLSDGTTVVNLNPSLRWVDEFSWAPVAQEVKPTITGALVVHSSSKLAGRPMTLVSDRADAGWMQLGALRQIKTWADTPGKQLTLTYLGVTRTVVFRHHEGSAVDSSPVVPFADPDDSDWYRVTLRFMVI